MCAGARSTLSHNLQYGRALTTPTVGRQHEISDAGGDLGPESRTVKHPIVADLSLQVVPLVFAGSIDAQGMRSFGLTDARDIVVLAFHRHQCNALDRAWIHAAATMRHLAFRQGVTDEYGIHRLQIEFGCKIHDGEIFVIEFAVLLRRI